MVQEGGIRVPMVLRWPGKVAPNQVINGVMSGLDWFPTFVKAAAYSGDIAADLRKGKELNGKTYKVHLDGYDQTDMLVKGGKSARNEVWYFSESELGAARVSATTSIPSSRSRAAGSGRSRMRTGPASSICVWIPSSARQSVNP